MIITAIPPETINNALAVLKQELLNQQIDIVIEAAAEHYFDESFEAKIDKGELMTMGDNYVLFEFSFINAPPQCHSCNTKTDRQGL